MKNQIAFLFVLALGSSVVAQEVSIIDPNQQQEKIDRSSPNDGVRDFGSTSEPAKVVVQDASLLNKIFSNHVFFDFAISMDNDKEVNLIRSDVTAKYEWVDGRLRFFVRVNVAPYLVEKQVKEYLYSNPEIIEGAASKMAYAVRQGVAAQLGRPVESIILPEAQIKAILVQKLGVSWDEALASNVKTFVDEKISEEARANAMLRELGLAFDFYGFTAELGKLDFLLASGNDYRINPAQVQTAFRLSRPAARLRYTSSEGGFIVALEVGNDAGLGSLYNTDANVGLQYIATLLQRSSGEKFFNLTNVNSWELTVIRSVPHGQILVATGDRPSLNSTKRDSKYLVARYDARIGRFSLDIGGNLEKVDSETLGQFDTYTIEGGAAVRVKGNNIGSRVLYRKGHLPREQFTALFLGANRGLWSMKGMTVGVGARGSAFEFHDSDEGIKFGAEAVVGVTKQDAPKSFDDLMRSQDARKNAERLKATKKKSKK